MNIATLSTNRLSPAFWGDEPDPERTSRRLAGLMLHSVGHLLNLEHSAEPNNAMYDFTSVEDLERMQEVAPQQRERMHRILPREARDDVEDGGRFPFVLRHILQDWHVIVQTVIRANPFELLRQLPTMLTAAFSVIIVLFFNAEIWDVASTVELGQLIIFSILALIAAVGLLAGSLGGRADSTQLVRYVLFLDEET